jgi:hypothetical protein
MTGMGNQDELRQRRSELQAKLEALSGQRDHAYRANNNARSLQRAGVTNRAEADMTTFADAETAGDEEMTSLRREIMSIDQELQRDHPRGLRNRAKRLFR